MHTKPMLFEAGTCELSWVVFFRERRERERERERERKRESNKTWSMLLLIDSSLPFQSKQNKLNNDYKK